MSIRSHSDEEEKAKNEHRHTSSSQEDSPKGEMGHRSSINSFAKNKTKPLLYRGQNNNSNANENV